MARNGKTLVAWVLSAALLVPFAYGRASAESINVAFQFEGLEITDDGGALDIGLLSLTGPITNDNIDLVEFATTLNLTNPLHVGVGQTFTLGWNTIAGAFTDAMTETSVNGSFDSLLTIVATGTILGGGFSATPSRVTLVFADSGLQGSFTTLSSLAPVPEPSTWIMFGLGFMGLAGMGYAHARRPVRVATSE